LQNLENLIEQDRALFSKVAVSAENDPVALQDSSLVEMLQIDPYYLSSILLNSSEQYLNHINTDECLFFSSLEANLLDTEKKNFKGHILRYKKPKSETFASAIMQEDKFFKIIYSKKCKNNLEIAKLFKRDDITNSIKGTTFTKPKNRMQCSQIYNSWKSNSYTPYLCQVPEVIDKGFGAREFIRLNPDAGSVESFSYYRDKISYAAKLEKEISYEHRSYIATLCKNLDSEENFCSTFLDLDFWKKVEIGDQPLYYMKYRCPNLTGSGELFRKQLKECADILAENENLCRTYDFEGMNGLFPMPSCNQITRALASSRFISNFNDCPSHIENEGITNLHRLMMHFDPQPMISKPESCLAEVNLNFVTLQSRFEVEKSSALKICYRDRIINQDVCLPYVPGHHPSSALAETKVVTRILSKTKGHNEKDECKVVETSKFNPSRLEYKVGCFIIFDQDQCTPLQCPKQIIYNQNLVKDLRYEGEPLFYYFATSYVNTKHAGENMVSEVLKLEKKELKNLTEINFFLEQNPLGLIHGVGCAEDLLPHFFKRRAFNECRPLPFIIDGVRKDKEHFLTVFRSSIHSIHSPELVPFNFVFTAISNYQFIHPLKTWTLYGLRKIK
jgi:hypothetical protein